MFNITMLFNYVLAYDTASFAYHEAIAQFKRKYHRAPSWGRGMTDEEEYTAECFDAEGNAAYTVKAISDVLGLYPDQRERLFVAGRIIKRWNIMTNFERYMPDHMVTRLWGYVLGDD